MPMTSGRPKSISILGCLVLACLALAACTGGHYTSKVNGEKKASYVNEQGTNTSVYGSNKDGQTTSHDAQDSMAKRQAVQHTAGQRRAKIAEQLDGLSPTPKRRPNDLIYVNLVPPVLDSKMQQAEKSKGAVDRQIRSEFTTDPIIKLVEGNSNSSSKGRPGAAPSIVDIKVSPKVSIKEVYVLQPQTGKPGKMAAVVFEATITSQNPPATSTVSETGHILQNVETSKRFTRQIKRVILERIGPAIPAH